MLLEEQVREVLVAHRAADLRRRDAARAPERATRGERERSSWSRSVSGITSRTSCSAHQLRERGNVRLVRDARHERHTVGVVQRRREPVDVGRDRGRARPREGADDVDALPGAREEDRGHGGQRSRARPASGVTSAVRRRAATLRGTPTVPPPPASAGTLVGAAEEREGCPQQDLQVDAGRAVLDVPDVELDPLRPG